MIIVRLHGGLGNQMFQYALGLNIAKQLNSELKLDVSWYYKKSNQNRKYLLDIFNIKDKFSSKSEIDSFTYKKGVLNRIKKYFDKFKPYYKRLVVKEQSKKFDNKILKIDHNCYLDGYWQSEKYFKVIKNELIDIYNLKEKIDAENSNVLDHISHSNSVSIHIRRGDYVYDKNTNHRHGTCSFKYYKDALSFINSKLSDPFFYIFSDDLEWVKNNMKINFPKNYIDINNGKKDYLDLILMSKCKHNIIANSSFSWWAAWLNTNNDKIVIAPKKWFSDPKVYTKDIIPCNWIKI